MNKASTGGGGLGNLVTSQVGAASALQVLATCIDLVFVAIFSRLLSPYDYGVVAAAMLFIAFCDLLRDVGIGSTLVQLPKLSVTDQRTGFTLVLFTSALIFAAVHVAAPFFAAFMRIPDVESVLRVLSFIIVVQAISTISQGLLLRDLRARQVMTIEIAAKFCAYSSLGIGMAYLGYGYWALVAASLGEAGLRSLAFTVAARPELRPAFDGQSLRRLTSVGSGFALSRLINFVALRADVTVVGRYLDTASLGIYSRAYRLMSLPADLYGKVADRVVFPAMARVQGDPKRLRNAYLRGIRLTALLGMPMTVLLCILAPEIIAVLLGPKWSAVVPVFFALSTATYFRLSARVSGSLLRATASTRAIVLTQVLYVVLTVSGASLAVPHGLLVVGAAISIAVVCLYMLITWCACRVAGVTLPVFAAAHLHGLFLGVAFGAATFLIVWALRDMHLPAIRILAFIGVILVLLGLVLIISKPRSLLGEEGVTLATRMQDSFVLLNRRFKRA